MSTLQDLYAACPSLETLTDGYTLGLNNSGYYGNIRFWIAGGDLNNFLTTVGGMSKTLTIGGNEVQRLIPLIHPYLPSGFNCYADSVDAKPPNGSIASLDGSGMGISYPDYFIDVHFSTPAYPYENGDYPCCRIKFDCGEERVTRPGSSYKFPSDGLRLNHDVGVPVKTIDFTLIMYRLPQLSPDLYSQYLSCVNLTDFYGFPAGTVIYEGPGVEGEEVIAGQPSYNCAHRFKYRSIPHNQIMRPDGTGFEAPIEEGGGTPNSGNEEDDSDPIYLLPEGELNDLWGY